MGCDGCELWKRGVRKCYAGKQTANYAGRAGWPMAFEKPKLFLERLEPALKWKDLTGLDREDKPWLNGLPRIVFLNDMGDTFSKDLPDNWMAPILPRLAQSRHQFLLLTKRPAKLLEFSRRFPLPPNVWPGTTITSMQTARRADSIRAIESGGPKFLSCEPLWSALPLGTYDGFDWVIFGGESGENEDCAETDIDMIAVERSLASTAHAKVFVKQLGSKPMRGGDRIALKDWHGGDWGEWPDYLQYREMPVFNYQQALL